MKITIEKYNSNWINFFEDEQKIIAKVIGNYFPAIDHIGSTSISGLAAKPVIDILVGLKTESDLDKVIDPMINSGFTYFKIYEPDMPYRRLFVKLKSLTNLSPPKIIDVNEEYSSGKDFISLTHIHIVVKDTYHWTRHIAFRDFLRTHPENKNEYAELKIKLSQKEFTHHLEYGEAKDDFIKKTEQLALIWFRNKIDNNNTF